jgi:hypothetical protein
MMQQPSAHSDISIINDQNGTSILYKDQLMMQGLRIETPTQSTSIQVDQRSAEIPVDLEAVIQGNTITFYLRTNGHTSDYWGMFFQSFEFSSLVQIWRYYGGTSPWNCPVRIQDPTEFQEEQVNFCYWKSRESYGCMVPICGYGFRTTLGKSHGQIGSKAYSHVRNWNAERVPLLLLAFGEEPYPLFSQAYQVAAQQMKMGYSLRKEKVLPPVYEYIGWCSWNSSNNGSLLNEDWLLQCATYFAKELPLGWVLIDDGWMDHTNRALNDFHPNPKLFPHGFLSCVEKIQKLGVKFVGLWHTLNAYWGGIHHDSVLGKQFESSLYAYGNNYFIRPEKQMQDQFWGSWYHFLEQNGISFVKVDNQYCAQDLGAYVFPVFDLAQEIHSSLNRAAKTYFGNGLLNCMDMSIECVYNFGTSATARASEDYFPDATGYDIKHGNASAHIMQACYNSIYFSQFVYPDLDMFETHNPHGLMHAVSRTLNNGPIYFTDRMGQCDFEMIKKLCYANGRTIRSDTPLLPTTDCLFQLQDQRVFKLFSLVKREETVGLMMAGNFADSDYVKGSFSPSDIEELKGSDFVVFDYFERQCKYVKRSETMEVGFERMEFGLYFIVPATYPVQPIGLINKFNAPSTIKSIVHMPGHTTITLMEGGTFAAAVRGTITHVQLDGKQLTFTQKEHLITVNIPGTDTVTIELTYQ